MEDFKVKEPKITTIRRWTAARVRQVCIDNNLYTCGDNEAYTEMLDRVSRLKPTTKNIYSIAEDIQRHSEDQTITNVMFLLENHAVITTFEINGDENI